MRARLLDIVGIGDRPLPLSPRELSAPDGETSRRCLPDDDPLLRRQQHLIVRFDAEGQEDGAGVA